MVSVIMLTYNHQKHIQQALDGVLMQKTVYPYEILIGDDASTDGTQEILKEYQSKYPLVIRLFLSDENHGTTKNAYRLFQKARGKYLASCEGDDYWASSDKLQTQVGFLEAHSEYVGCSHRIHCVDDEGHIQKSKKLHWISNKRIYTINDFKGIILPGHSCSLVRRNIFLSPKAEYSAFWQYDKYIGDRTAAVLWASEGNFYQMKQYMSCYRCSGSVRKSNVTHIVYVADEQKNIKELVFTEKLESLAEELTGREYNFDFYRCRIFLSALSKGLTKSRRSELSVAATVWKKMKSPMRAALRLPLIFVSMAAEKIRRK